MRPSQTFQSLETLRGIPVGPLHRKGVELSFDDSQTVLDVYQQWLLLCTDLGYLHPSTLLRNAQRLWTDMVRADVLELNNAFAELLGKVRTQNSKGFKALCMQISSHLHSLVKKDFELTLQGDVYAAKRLVQLFSYTSRLSLTDIDLTQQCLDDYVETEGAILESFPTHLIRPLNKIIRKWMKFFDPSRLLSQHGPGGVAGHGRASLEVKYKDLTFDDRLNYAFRDETWTYGPIRSSLDRISQTIFVPKSYKTFRTISMESSTLQFYQQGVWKEIDRLVAGNRYLVNRIGFHEQNRNQLLAQEGSISRNFATIDLSAASDSVSYSLVKKLFRGTKVLRYLFATRSTKTLLPDGRLIALRKFAPMGSALCFPVETIIFAAICEFVTWEHDVNGKYSVFGDDIIVPTTCVADTMHILETLGFRVNRDKSFYQSDCWFRESCGAEYCDGFDVTPVRVSRQYASRERLVRLSQLISLANSAHERGYRNLRYFFIRKLRDSGYTPLFAPTELLSDNYTNYHARRRWNPNLQRVEAETSSLFTKISPEVRDSQDETIRYHHWLLSTAGRNSLGDGFQSTVCRSIVSFKDRWRPKPYEPNDQAYIDFNISERRK